MGNFRSYLKKLFNLMGFEVRRYKHRPAHINNGVDNSQGNLHLDYLDWARVNQLFDFNSRQLYTSYDIDADNYNVDVDFVLKQKWGLKGYGYSVVLDLVRKLHKSRSDNLKILDVGGAGSALPRAIFDQFGDQCWLIDDFGVESNDYITQGWYARVPNLRETLPLKHPMIHYVFGRLGEGKVPELKSASFDLIYSVSTLEHISMKMMPGVFNHMVDLLGPKGTMLHTIDLHPQEFQEWKNFLASYFRTRGVAPAAFEIANFDVFDENDPILMESPEVVYFVWNVRPKKYYPQSTLTMEIHRND